jgi:hypothetical protein
VSSPPICSAEGSQLRWKLNGGYLCPNESRKFTAINTTPVTVNGPGGKVILPECTETGNLAGPSGGVAGSKTNVRLTCTGAYLEKDTSKKCFVKSPGYATGTVASNSLKSTLSGGVLTSEGTEALFTIEVTGELCSAAFKTKYEGGLKDVVQPIEKEVAGLSTDFSGSPVTSGVLKITVTGTMSTSPLSGALIGVFPG